MAIGSSGALLDHLRPLHWREAALGVPAIPVLIFAGIALGKPGAGLVAAGSAFVVGFGAARELRGRRWAAMLAVLVGLPLATFGGTIMGQNSAAFLLLACASAAGCAALALYDEDIWWVVLQIVIGLFLAGFYHGTAQAGLDRATFVLLGGLVQASTIYLLALAFPAASAPYLRSPQFSAADRALLVPHMVRATVAVACCLLLIRPLGLAYGYWAPMTALIVLKPRLSETHVRGLARVGGTVAGCLLATGYAALFHDQTAAMLVGVALATGAAYGFQKAHYAGLTVWITAAVVLLVSLGEATPLLNAEHRLAATLLGGVTALLVAAVIPHSVPRLRRRPDRIGA